jgi:hypothetical protein
MARWTAGLALSMVLGAGGAAAQEARVLPGHAGCDERDGDRDYARHCEVREILLPASGRLAIDATPNGGIQVTAGGGSEMRILAVVRANAREEAEARRMAEAVRILTDGTIRAEGPRPERRAWWSVSFRAAVPERTDVDLHSQNGGITLEGLRGRSRFETTNGGVTLVDLGGTVEGETTNGGVTVRLSGDRWEGEGLDVRTTNGGVTLHVPTGYNARLETATVNGAMDLRFPVQVQGRIGKRVSTELGSGGPTVRATTTNGGVVVRRR